MVTKLKRQTRIKEILLSQTIANQEKLVDLLEAEGIEITQATLSRDFAEMGVTRVSGDNGIHYIMNPSEAGSHIAKVIGFEILSVAHNESMIVVRTLAGRAQGVAFYFDRLNKQEILGTVAGDDTVLVIPDKHKNLNNIISFIKELMMNVPKQKLIQGE
ncbi:MAG: arginine repressor [Ignavibacteriaceae bacterium]|nr:arginine repressor [Ignavibacteriaceae bacterium]